MVVLVSVLLAVFAACKAQAVLDIVPGASWTAVRIWQCALGMLIDR